MEKTSFDIEVNGEKVNNPILKIIICVIALGLFGLIIAAVIGLILLLISMIGGIIAVLIVIVVGLVSLIPLLAIIHCVFRAFGRRGLFVTEHEGNNHSYTITFHGAGEKVAPQKRSNPDE